MVPAKLLVGGTVAVGSVSTAAVVANQYGLFSTSASVEGNQNTKGRSEDEESNIPSSIESEPQNSPESTTINDTNDSPASAIVPTPATEPTTSQTKTEKQEIKELIKTIGTDIEVRIKIGNSSTETSLENEQENNLEGLKDYLTEVIKNELKSLISGEHKTLIFNKNGVTWTYLIKKEHIKAWIKENWGNNTKLSIKDKNLDSLQAEDLKKLFEALKKNKDLFSHLKDEAVEKTIVFKKVSEDFKLSHNQVSIEAWVKTISSGKSTLKIWNNGTEQTNLSNLEETELEKLFASISSNTNEGLFKKGGENTVVVFEKDGNDWKHIKKALKDWESANSQGRFKLQIIKGDQTGEINIEDAKDVDLTGLLKYLNENKKTLISQPNTRESENTPAPLVFKKTNENWEQSDEDDETTKDTTSRE